MKKISVLLALLSCLAFALPALAEPFGVSMGDAMGRFPELAGKSGRTHHLAAVPAPQPGFQQHIVTFEEKDGLSSISGLAEFPADKGGVLAFFNQQNETLIQQYGPPVKYLEPGWINWLDAARPDDKALKAQLHQYRNYGFGAIWALEDRADGLDMVQVALVAKSETHCTAIVTYFFRNYQDVQ